MKADLKPTVKAIPLFAAASYIFSQLRKIFPTKSRICKSIYRQRSTLLPLHWRWIYAPEDVLGNTKLLLAQQQKSMLCYQVFENSHLRYSDPKFLCGICFLCQLPVSRRNSHPEIQKVLFHFFFIHHFSNKDLFKFYPIVHSHSLYCLIFNFSQMLIFPPFSGSQVFWKSSGQRRKIISLHHRKPLKILSWHKQSLAIMASSKERILFLPHCDHDKPCSCPKRIPECSFRKCHQWIVSNVVAGHQFTDVGTIILSAHYHQFLDVPVCKWPCINSRTWFSGTNLAMIRYIHFFRGIFFQMFFWNEFSSSAP